MDGADYQALNAVNMQGGLNTSAPLLSPASANSLAIGSWNHIVDGDGNVRGWSGGTSQGSNTGGNKMFPFGATWGAIRGYAYVDKTFVAPGAVGTNQVTITAATDYVTGLSCTVSTPGTLPTGLVAATVYYLIVVDATHLAFATTLANALLGTATAITTGTGSGTITIDVSNASVSASGNFFQDIGLSRWGIGSGQPMIAGVPVAGFSLSTNLQLQIAASGVYGPPVQAGLSQPSAPDLGIINTSGVVSNSVSAKLERTRPSTGANSLASPNSPVIVPQANRVRVTFPLAQTGQEAWRVFFTFQGFGGTGVSYLATYGNDTDIPETTVAAGVVDGIARSLEFNYQDGDLLPIEASFDDYPPPAATHAIRLNTVMNLAGCYSDSVSDPTTASPGTCIAVSKENNYESYIPTSLLYLPEQVVDVLARPLDDYGYIGCQNSISAIQYVGDRGDGLPPCTITTILPDIGIQYAYNWCHFRGQLLIYTAQGNLILMDETGNFNTTFAKPISSILKSLTTVSTSVGYHPPTDSILVMSGKMMFAYSIQADQWRQIWLPDFGITGTCVSATAAARNMYFSVSNAGALTAYTYDTGSATAPLSFASNYQNAGGVVVNDIYEMAIAAQTNVSTRLAVTINRNLTKSVFRQIQTTNTVANVTDSESSFTSNMNGKSFILFGTNVGGGGTVLLQGTITYVSASTITLSIAPSATLTDCLMFIGNYAANVAITAPSHLPNLFPNLVELRSWNVNVWFQGNASAGNCLTVNPIGTSYSSSRAL